MPSISCITALFRHFCPVCRSSRSLRLLLRIIQRRRRFRLGTATRLMPLRIRRLFPSAFLLLPLQTRDFLSPLPCSVLPSDRFLRFPLSALPSCQPVSCQPAGLFHAAANSRNRFRSGLLRKLFRLFLRLRRRIGVFLVLCSLLPARCQGSHHFSRRIRLPFCRFLPDFDLFFFQFLHMALLLIPMRIFPGVRFIPRCHPRALST